MLCVRDVMHTDFCRVERGCSVADVARLLLFHNAESALVVDGEELLGIVTEHDLLGIVTERDLLKAVLPTTAELSEADSLRAFSDLVTVARDHFAAPVDAVMTRRVRTIDAGASLIRALGTMLTGHFHRMPVVGPGGEVVGMVTQPDLLRAVFLEWQGGAATAG
jgi:CBS domain-containing protein